MLRYPFTAACEKIKGGVLDVRGAAVSPPRGTLSRYQRRIIMPTFILTLDWTDQGIRSVKEAPKRGQAARELAKKLGVEVKQIYLTSGEHDLLIIVDSPSGDNVAKFALATGSLGNVRTTTTRAWAEPEFHKLLSELP
jgi:uncharacterized protein with GYD domain